MRQFMTLALLASAGCAPFTHAQINLIDQTRRGVAMVAVSDQDRDRAIVELARLRREKLDQAFDEDVRLRATQETLNPDWVIESRKAYAAGLDAFAKTQAANDAAGETRKRNLAAIDATLDRLRWMLSIQLKFNLLPDEVTK